MEWPAIALEQIPASEFRPAFCPRADCAAHRGGAGSFVRHGSYARPSTGVRIPRFRCRRCKRTFSQQTFACTYYLKRPELLPPAAAALAACSAQRQLARSLGCAKTTAARLARRIGRHSVLLLGHAIDQLGPLAEPVVHDHFETFIGRQDRALGIGTAVGARSWFVFGPDPAPHRGSGRRPQRTALKSGTPPVPSPYVTSIRRSLDLLLGRVNGDRALTLVCDGRQDYTRAIAAHPQRARIRPHVHPNPPRRRTGTPRSAATRARDRAMFPVDQLHQLMRHSMADHKRETIAFGRRLEAILIRVFALAVWKNFVKGRSERKPDRTTPAMRLGLATEPWRWTRVLAQRLFPGRVRLPELWPALYGYECTPGARPYHPRHAA